MCQPKCHQNCNDETDGCTYESEPAATAFAKASGFGRGLNLRSSSKLFGESDNTIHSHPLPA
jgi:hypothetical protein